MREIKFRAWDKSINYMDDRVRVTTTNDYVKVEVLDAFSHWRELEQEQFELMQYTGLKDKNGVEIFEGDILDFTILEYGGGEIKYKGYVIIEEYGTFIKTDPDGDEFTETFYLAETVINDDELKVIGNIYENPELLEEC